MTIDRLVAYGGACVIVFGAIALSSNGGAPAVQSLALTDAAHFRGGQVFSLCYQDDFEVCPNYEEEKPCRTKGKCADEGEKRQCLTEHGEESEIIYGTVKKMDGKDSSNDKSTKTLYCTKRYFCEVWCVLVGETWKCVEGELDTQLDPVTEEEEAGVSPCYTVEFRRKNAAPGPVAKANGVTFSLLARW